MKKPRLIYISLIFHLLLSLSYKLTGIFISSSLLHSLPLFSSLSYFPSLEDCGFWFFNLFSCYSTFLIK
uniref:Uncharacterized protein n=1 Tax=Salix viminalis TaxID=40686 RepID=A0A6N2KD50_SALVM